ncbi:amidase family protein [Paeniglutamicibacter antarcticus]|uniref:Indoleacetamide hydrolase n=1 Tax=Paeniglutamicibacter antarcticus TaxID=494023 RepID=A0ABP9TRE4_9MICC
MSKKPTPGIWTYLVESGDSPAEGTALGSGLDAGFDFAVKANIEVAGLPASAGSPVFDGYLPLADSPVVTTLKRHGGRLAGLTNMHELAFGITSNNSVFGPVPNPFDPLRSAGGSSGGSAAAVAAGLVQVSLGTDTGGSVSIPAAACAVVGFRPTTGRWPGAGTIGLSWSRDTVGVHARSVAHVSTVDSWLTHNGQTGLEAKAPVLAVPTTFLLNLDPSVAKRFQEVLATLSKDYEVIEVDLDQVFAQTDAAQWDLVGWEAPRLLGAHLAAAENLSPTEAWKQVVARAASPDVRTVLAGYEADPVTADAYEQAVELMDTARENHAAIMAAAGIDALVFPTLPCLPTPIGQDHIVSHLGRQVPVFPLLTRHVGPGTVLGVPSVTLPAGLSDDGLPVGINLQGFAHQDRGLLGIAARVEALLATTMHA